MRESMSAHLHGCTTLLGFIDDLLAGYTNDREHKVLPSDVLVSAKTPR